MDAMECGSVSSDCDFLADRSDAKRAARYKGLGCLNARKSRDLEFLTSECMGAWMEFCGIPTHVKKGCIWPAGKEFYPSGYELKAAHASSGHVVEYMQVSSRGAETRIERLGKCHDYARCVERKLTIMSSRISEMIMPHVAQFFDAINVGCEDDIRWPDGQQRFEWGIRMAHTLEAGANERFLVEPHVDPSFVSANLIDAGSETEYLDYETRMWMKMPCRNDEVAIFGGIGLQCFSKNKCKALCHRVRRADGVHETFGCTYMLELPFMRYRSPFSLKRFGPGFTYDASLDDIRAIYNGTFVCSATGS